LATGGANYAHGSWTLQVLKVYEKIEEKEQ